MSDSPPIPEKYVRPTWDETWMECVHVMSKRATCNRGRSGCFIVRDNRVLASGYVGSLPGFPHCDDVGHLFKETIHEDGHKTQHCVRTVHAEENTILQAATSNISLRGSTLYCVMTPCPQICAPMIVTCGIVRVVCDYKYKNSAETEELFLKAGIQIYFVHNELQQYESK